MLVIGNLPWLSVSEQPAQGVWKLSQRPSRRQDGTVGLAPESCAYFQCRDLTWERCHDKSFLMSHAMPQLYKSYVFSWNKKYIFFTACFFCSSCAFYKKFIAFGGFSHLTGKAFRAEIAAPEQPESAEKEIHEQHVIQKMNLAIVMMPFQHGDGVGMEMIQSTSYSVAILHVNNFWQ